MLAPRSCTERLFLFSSYRLAGGSPTGFTSQPLTTADSRRPSRRGLDEHLPVAIVVDELDSTLQEFFERFGGTVDLPTRSLSRSLGRSVVVAIGGDMFMHTRRQRVGVGHQ